MGILRRTIFLAQDNSAPNTGTPIRTSGWASVITSLGQCAEPCPSPFPFFAGVSGNASFAGTEQNFTDDIARVDEIAWLNLTSVCSPFTGSDQNKVQLHGGTLVPRVGP